MKVEPTGMVTVGECQVRTRKCQARTPDPITVVYVLPENTQLNVCRACLEEKMRRGEWQIEGARLEAGPVPRARRTAAPHKGVATPSTRARGR